MGANENTVETFTFSALPAGLEEMKKLPEAALTSPFQTAALTVLALCAYANSVDDGIEMLNFLKGPQPLSEMDKSFLKDRFMDKNYVPISYFEGSKPENNYTPSEPHTLMVKTNPYTYAQEGYCKLFLKSGGADADRSVTLRKKGDQWFLWGQQLLPSIRKPVAEDPWA